MKLKSPALERRLRKTARREMRADKPRWKEYKLHRTRRWREALNNGAGVRQFYYLAAAGWLVALARDNPIRLLLLIAIYAMATAINRGLTLQSDVIQGPHRVVLLTMPIADQDYFRVLWQTRFWPWMSALTIFVIAFGACEKTPATLEAAWLQVLLVAVLQTLVCLCISLLSPLYVPKSASVVTMLYIVIIAGLGLPVQIVMALWQLVLVTPGGWVAHGFAGVRGLAHPPEVLWLIPSAAVALGVPFAYRAFKTRMLGLLGAQTDEALLSPDTTELTNEEQVRLAEAEKNYEDNGFLRGNLLGGVNWRGMGWLERLAGTWYSEREKTVAEFMIAARLGAWSRGWRNAALVSAAGIAAIAAIRYLPSRANLLMDAGYGSVAMAALICAPLFSGLWPGFERLPSSGYAIPIFAGFPIRYGEISKVIFKANLLRTAAWAPLCMACMTAIWAGSGKSPIEGLLTGLKIVLVVVAAQPGLIAGQFFMTTGDAKRLTWQFGAMALLTVLLFLTFLASGIALFAANWDGFEYLTLPLMFGLSTLLWAAYRHHYRRGRCDLVTTP